jgi:hypothetical protein
VLQGCNALTRLPLLLAAGVGVHLGETSPLGGRMVDAPLAGSPAEAAGIVRGDRILDIGAPVPPSVRPPRPLSSLPAPMCICMCGPIKTSSLNCGMSPEWTEEL